MYGLSGYAIRHNKYKEYHQANELCSLASTFPHDNELAAELADLHDEINETVTELEAGNVSELVSENSKLDETVYQTPSEFNGSYFSKDYI